MRENEPVQYAGEYVLTTDGSKDFGEIGADTGLPAGKIRLRKGLHNTAKGSGYGESHIERPDRLKQLKQNGYDKARDIVQEVAKQFSAIYEGGNNALFLVKQGLKKSLIIVKLKTVENDTIYDVETAYIVRGDFFKNKKKLWEKPQSFLSLESEGRSPTGNNPPSAFSGNPTPPLEGAGSTKSVDNSLSPN